MTMKEKIMKHVCCFCGAELPYVDENGVRWGANPYPACKIEHAECCNRCDLEIVLPVRFMRNPSQNDIDCLIESVVGQRLVVE